jgi:hypothetical protein
VSPRPRTRTPSLVSHARSQRETAGEPHATDEACGQDQNDDDCRAVRHVSAFAYGVCCHASRAAWRMLHPGRAKRRPPASLVVLSQLQIEALAVHPHRNAPNPSPRVQPGAENMDGSVL